MSHIIKKYIYIAVQCNALLDPANGVVSTTGYGVGDIAIYTCNEGYVLLGSDTQTCLSSGQWSGSPATCGGKLHIYVRYT